jgi:alanine dehydrogenase
MPLIIKKEQIAKVLKMKDVVNIMEETFKMHGLGKIQQPSKTYLFFPDGDLRSMPTCIASKTMNVAGIKAVNVHPNNHKLGLPTVMATILLVNPKNGYNIAVMDGTLITEMRTGAAGGLAAKYLAKKDAKVAGFVGAGKQAYTQLEALMIVRPIKLVKAYDINKETAKKFCNWAAKKYNIDAIVCASVREATRESDIVTTVTPARAPIVKAEDISPGTHINAIGADAPGKQELASALTKKATIVIDEWEQASHSGEINVPLAQGIITRKDIYGELGKIVAKLKKGRTNNKQITMFDSTGLACQDISTAYVAYKRLKNRKDMNLADIKLFKI